MCSGRRPAESVGLRSTRPRRARTVALALLVGFALAVYPALPSDPDATRHWAEDLDAFVEGLESHHIDPYHSISRADLRSEIESLRSSLPGLVDAEVVVELMRLARLVGDGHTAIPLWDRSYARFPLEVAYLDGEALVVGTAAENENLLGSRLVSIDGNATEVIAEELSHIVPFVENPYSEAVRIGGYFMIADVLHALELTREHGTAEFVFDLEGEPVTRRFAAETGTAHSIDDESRLFFRTLGEHREFARVDANAWAASLNQGRTVFVYIDRYPDEQTFDDFAQAVLAFIDEQRSENLIIDLRDSFGGDFFSGLNFASWLVTADSIDWRSGVYTLISNRTFSAAMSNSVQFRQILNARLVGQPTGARPCGYQDGASFRLPHSELLVMVSKRRYCFEDTHAPAVIPTVSIPLHPDDYRQGRDRVMEWVRSDIASRLAPE